MKLIHRINIRVSLVLLVLLSIWAGLFYFIIMDEINDETDDSLEDYSEHIITRALAKQKLPSEDNATNNTYFIKKISAKYAANNKGFRYSDEMIYIESKKETEPARILKTIYKDADGQYFELTVAIPTIEKADLRETILRWIIFLYVLLLLSIVIVNFWILQQSFKPLYALMAWLNNYRIGKAIPPLNTTTKVEEFRKLNHAILKSAERNSEMYEQQKLFIGHASHEMQTPLAVCKNRLELLINDPALSEEQLAEIIRTLENLNHLIKLNKTLLLLTKIDNQQFHEIKEVNIANLVQKLTEDFKEVFAYRSINVEISGNADLVLTVNEVLANVLISNLIKNAFVHNHNNGTIVISTDKNLIQISNTGKEEALPRDAIFKRFFQGSKKSGSTGLGLALVDSICRLYGIRHEYSFTGQQHNFRLFFPSEIIN